MMLARWPRAFALSTTLHVVAIGAALWLGVTVVEHSQPPDAFLQMVLPSGHGRVVEPSGSSSPGIRFRLPAPPVHRPEPTVQASPEIAAVPAPRAHPAETRPPSTSHPAAATPTARTNVSRATTAATSNTRPPRASTTGTTTVQHVDTTAITGALRSETAIGKNKGTGGSELGSADYRALMEQRLLEILEQVPGLDDGLRAEAVFDLSPEGRTSHPKLTLSSGNERFDAAVIEAIRTVILPPPPAGFERLQRVPFTTKAR